MKRLELAHRGARLTKNHTVLYVENSLPAILAGLNVVNGVEIDVFYIKGTWWISHDFELSRFDSKETLQTASTDTVLKQENKVSRLITIESLIKALNNQPLKEPKLINIEIKQHNNTPSLEDCIKLINLINTSIKNKQISVYYSSFDFNLINELKQHHRVGYLFDTMDELHQLKDVNDNVFVITVQHNSTTQSMLSYITKKFGNRGGVYFSSENDYFNNKENYTNVKVIYCEPFCD